MESAPTLLSASLVLLLLPTAAADGDATDVLLLDLAAQAQQLLSEGRDPALLQPVSSPGTVCVWYEPGLYVESVVVDVNHYLVQVPVPAVDPGMGTNGEPAGTYFIQVSFSGAECSP